MVGSRSWDFFRRCNAAPAEETGGRQAEEERNRTALPPPPLYRREGAINYSACPRRKGAHCCCSPAMVSSVHTPRFALALSPSSIPTVRRHEEYILSDSRDQIRESLSGVSPNLSDVTNRRCGARRRDRIVRIRGETFAHVRGVARRTRSRKSALHYLAKIARR